VSSENAGNHDWCERLYDNKAAQLILYSRAFGLSHGEAEDVVQEAFIALLRIPKKPDSPEAYLYRTVRNRALNYKRGFWRRVARELESSRWFERSPDETEAERAAMRCLQDLPPEQREVIVLKIWSRHTFEEIGNLLDLSPNTVAGRYRYGMQKLRASLKGIDYESLELQRGSIAEVDPAPSFA
jgi:RNA polymerase sigma-70 factor, ECF subfamily